MSQKSSVIQIANLVPKALTPDTPPRDGAASYEHHDFEQEAYAAVEKLAAELERVRQAVPVSGGEETPGGWKNYPGMQWGQKGPASFAWFLQLVASHHHSR